MTDRLPVALSQAVHTLATTAPPAPTDLDQIRRRAGVRRRRRIGLQAALALVVVAALGAAFVLIPRTRHDPPDPAAPVPPAKRLILNATNLPHSFGDADFLEPSQVFPEAIPELQPDGTVKLLPKPAGLLPPFQVVPTPDGRLVVLGYASREPETQRLVLLGRDLTVLGQHDLTARRRPSPGTHLYGASDTEVFLAGADGGVLDLATWQPVAGQQPLPVRATYIDANASALLVLRPDESGRCGIAVLDPRSKQLLRALPIPPSGCGLPFGLRLSPDGTRVAAVAYTRDDLRSPSFDRTLYILDADTGALVGTHPLGPGPESVAQGEIVWTYFAVGWASVDTVVVASGTVPAGGLDRLAASLDVKRFTVPPR